MVQPTPTDGEVLDAAKKICRKLMTLSEFERTNTAGYLSRNLGARLLGQNRRVGILATGMVFEKWMSFEPRYDQIVTASLMVGEAKTALGPIKIAVPVMPLRDKLLRD